MRENGLVVLWERLDRALSSVDWLDMYPTTVVHYLTRIASDYRLLLVDIEGTSFSGPKPFRLEKFWFENEGMRDVVTVAWTTMCRGLLRLDWLLKINMLRRLKRWKCWSNGSSL